MAAQMRVSIIRAIGDKLEEVVPHYGEDEFLSRLRANLNEQFLVKENYWKRRFMRAECLGLLEKAYEKTIMSLKEETIKLP